MSTEDYDSFRESIMNRKHSKNTLDYEGAMRKAEEILLTLDSHKYIFHNRDHTFGEVLPTGIYLMEQEGINSDSEKGMLIKTAMGYHDTGHTAQYSGHEEASIEIARKVLPRFDYSQKQIDTVARIISATRIYPDLKQKPEDNLDEKIMCDSDICNLGTDIFFVRTHQLMIELERLERNYVPKGDVLEWYKAALTFMLKHGEYFTQSARKAFGEKKKENMKQLELLIAQSQ